jgi:hypothetical protein
MNHIKLRKYLDSLQKIVLYHIPYNSPKLAHAV